MKMHGTEDNQATCDLTADRRPGRCGWCGQPLPARRRKWCSDECAYAYADQHVWEAARRAALDRDGWRCVRCGDRGRLHVHHHTPVADYSPGCHHHLAGLVSLCRPCHLLEHEWARGPYRVRQLELAGC